MLPPEYEQDQWFPNVAEQRGPLARFFVTVILRCRALPCNDLGRAGLNRSNPRLFRRLVDDPQESKVVFESLGVGPVELEDIGLAQGGAPLVPSAQGTREHQPVALNSETSRPPDSTGNDEEPGKNCNQNQY